MEIRHIVAATDESDAGREAVRMAIAIAAMAGARVTVMRAVQTSSAGVIAGVPVSIPVDDGGGPALERLERWLEPDMPKGPDGPRVSTAVAFGVPGVEIARFAEHEQGDLLVLGRKPRSRMARLLVGDTADAVARRSRLPCFFVPPGSRLPKTVLAAVDGTERGLTVLQGAAAIARALQAKLGVVTVEPLRDGEPKELATANPSAGSMRLRAQVKSVAQSELEIRHGDAAEQILLAVESHRPDVLILGCHRGGPPGIIEAGSTARRLAHTAPCAVITIPL